MDTDDQDHRRCLQVLEQRDLRLVIPALVVAEATYLVGTRLGPRVEAQFLAALEDSDVRAPEAADWPRIGELVKRHADFPLGGVDASVVALAERLGTELIITLDHRHFRAVRDRQDRPLRLLP